jgi:rhodanese-related sulfurtransferase
MDVEGVARLLAAGDAVRAVNLDGGMKAWVRAALPLEPPGGGIA